MTPPAIQVERLSKLYRVGRRERYLTLRDVLAEAAAAPARRLARLVTRAPSPELLGEERMWALRDLSFTVAQGEVLGVIGRNGAGKTTLLKILSRIVDPTGGRVEIQGRVGSLLEVGTGFHSELTGRENIYLNGAILGMRRTEIARKFDEIVAFAETERFIDTPVKHYSSGMYMRLAFAVAAHLETQVLLVDEVLAVGDVAFQAKCMGKMGDVAQAGRTVLFVSHNMEAVQRLCGRCLLLDGGRLVEDAPSTRAVTRYLSEVSTFARPNEWLDLTESDRSGTGDAYFTGLHYASDSPTVGFRPYTYGPLEITLAISSDVPRAVGSLAVTIYNQLGTKLVNADTLTLQRPVRLAAGTTRVRVRIERLYLTPGRYRLGLWLADPIASRRAHGAFDHLESAVELEVYALDGDRIGVTATGVVPCEFTVSELPGPDPAA